MPGIYDRSVPPLKVFSGCFDSPGIAHALRVEVYPDHLFFVEELRPQFYDGSVEYSEQSLESARTDGPHYGLDYLKAEDRAYFLRILGGSK